MIFKLEIFSLFTIGLCSWVVNIIGFYNVYCDVEPKRRALEAANADLAAAEDKLAKIKAKIKVRQWDFFGVHSVDLRCC